MGRRGPRGQRTRAERLRRVRGVIGVAVCLLLALAAGAARPAWAPWIALAEGLVVGTILGAADLAPDYDSSWDEFFETTLLACLLGPLALLVCLVRRERPNAFLLIESLAGGMSDLLLLFVPPVTWLGADLLLFAGVFVGWFFSGLFRPGYE